MALPEWKADPRTVSGTIETDEAHVASRYGGRVERIHASEGNTLTNGQLMIDLDAAELRAMQAPLKERYKSTPEAATITLKKGDRAW